MALAALQVVDALIARLMPMPATGARIFDSRTVTLNESDLPCWRITAEDEPVEPAAINGADQHDLEVHASVYCRDTLTLDRELSALAASGLALLFADPRAFGLRHVNTLRSVVDVGEASAGRYTLVLRATFFVNPAQPELLLSS
jgi:hypothetical protein